MVTLADRKRTEYARYAPTFWRKAPQGVTRQQGYFRDLLDQPATIALVSDEAGRVDGFLMAQITDAPPVYDPGTRVLITDDFTIEDAALWPTVGRGLLDAARTRAAAQGAQLTVVVCGHLDEPKRHMLRSAGLEVASEWYVSPL